MKLFSNDWATTLKTKINRNQEYKNSSENLEMRLAFNISTENRAIILELKDSECKKVHCTEEKNFVEVDFIIDADAETWQKILTKNLPPMQALLMKKLIITKGEMSDLLPYVNALKEILNSATEVETDY